MASLFAGLLQALLGLFFPKKVEPSNTQLADSNAHAEDAATQETNNAAALNTALAARTIADVAVMRHDPTANEIHSDVSAPINNLGSAEHFRD